MGRRSFSSANAKATRQLKEKQWDALVIGGGHNGLTAAAHLSRGGLSVAVFERRHVIGGAAATEELIPGFRFSRCSYLQSLLRPSVIRLSETWTEITEEKSVIVYAVFGWTILGPNKELNHSEISKFSKRDADAYPRYEDQLEKFCKFTDPHLDSATPELLQGNRSFNERFKNKIHNLTFGLVVFAKPSQWGTKTSEFVDLLLSPASKVLKKWFEADVLMATLATDAVIGTTVTIIRDN